MSKEGPFVTFKIDPTEEALLISTQSQEGIPSPLAMLNEIGLDEATKMIGKYVLTMLRLDDPERFTRYPNLIFKPEPGPTREEVNASSEQLRQLDERDKH